MTRSAEIAARQAELTAIAQQTMEAARANRNAETMEAARKASAELSAFIAEHGTAPKSGRAFYSRAGLRHSSNQKGRR